MTNQSTSGPTNILGEGHGKGRQYLHQPVQILTLLMVCGTYAQTNKRFSVSQPLYPVISADRMLVTVDSIDWLYQTESQNVGQKIKEIWAS